MFISIAISAPPLLLHFESDFDFWQAFPSAVETYMMNVSAMVASFLGVSRSPSLARRKYTENRRLGYIESRVIGKL